MRRAREITPDMFGAPVREASAFDVAAELHARMARERNARRKHETHAAAMELIYRALGPKVDGTVPQPARRAR